MTDFPLLVYVKSWKTVEESILLEKGAQNMCTILSVILEQKQIKIRYTERIRIEAKKRIWCSVLNQQSTLLFSLVKQ